MPTTTTGRTVQDQELQRRSSTTTLTSSDARGRTWTITTTIRCTADKHDTLSAYKNHGCRCPKATERVVAYQRRRDNGQILPSQPAELTMRRLQALAVIGWTCQDIAPLVRRNPVTLTQTRRGHHAMVTGATAAAVHKVYRQMHDKPGPSKRCRDHAVRQGWQGPSLLLLYGATDEVKIARAVRGEDVELSRAERLTAVHLLHHASRPYDDIADRLHIAQRQVHRDLTDLGLIDRKAATG